MTTDERQCWYNIAVTAGLGPSAAQRIGRYLDVHHLGASDLEAWDAERLQGEIGLSGGIAAALVEQFCNQLGLPEIPEGIDLLTPGEARYPNHRFVDANPPLPPVLWAGADTSLLSRDMPALAIAGSRDTADEILDFVYEFSRDASRSGWMIVSGLAQGVDSAAHRGALIGSTGTIGVLASGVLNTSRSWMPDDAESFCVVSQFNPTEPWSGPRAMQRNSTIAGLADRVLVAAAGSSGGSWEMAQLCLKRNKPLFVLDLDPKIAPGNRKLIQLGAISVNPDEPDVVLAEIQGPLTLFS